MRLTWNKHIAHGYTLVESMIAVTVLGIALGACVLSFSLAIRIVNTSANQMTAIHFARAEVELLRSYSFTNAALNVGTCSITNILLPANYGGSYTVDTNVDANTKTITVNLTYLNRVRGGISTNTLVTCVTRCMHPHQTGSRMWVAYGGF